MTDTKKLRKMYSNMNGIMSNTIVECCDVIDTLRARITDLESRLDIGTGNMYDVVVAENEKLRARVAELEAANRWIPVEERLPHPGQQVSMWIQPFSYVPGNEKLGAYMPMTAADAPWRSTWDMIYYAPSEVTHWRPLPNPPEVKG